MHPRKKTLLAALVFIFVSTLAPISILAGSYLHAQEDSIYRDLQVRRSELTQLSNDKHRFEAYAQRLSWDRQLSAIARKSARIQPNWQTPMQQVRIRIIDGLKQAQVAGQVLSAVSLDWLSASEYTAASDSELQSVWVQAEVRSVSHGIKLIQLFKGLARPFPVYVHGCSYQRSEPSEIQARCRITLEAWALPEVNHHGVVDNVSAVHASKKIHNPICCSENSALYEWRLFKSKRSYDMPIVSKTKNSSLAPMSPKETVVNAGVSRAIITGPAGRLVIHAQSK